MENWYVVTPRQMETLCGKSLHISQQKVVDAVSTQGPRGHTERNGDCECIDGVLNIGLISYIPMARKALI